MAHIVSDRVQETTTTTGTGALTLAGAVANFSTFASRMTSPSDTCWYAIVDSTNNAWEVGLGTYSAANTLTRTTVIRSSNSDAVVTLAAGTKNVFMTLAADKTPIFGPVNEMKMPAITAEPGAPPTDNMYLYAKKISGKMIPKIKGPSGLDTPLQVGLWQNNIIYWTPTSAVAGSWQGALGTQTGAGTYTVGVPTTTNLYTVQPRGKYANVVTTANQILGIRVSSSPINFLGNVAGQGGFFFFARMGFDVWTNGGRMFAGLSASVSGTTVSSDPSTINNTVGFCVDAADNGAISFLMRGTAATKTSTGITIVSNRGYDLFMWAAPNSTTVNWRIIDTVNGAENSGSTSTNAPAAATMLAPQVLASNAALTPVTSIHLGVNRVYVETDY